VLLGYLDSNQDYEDQSLAGCLLPHTPLEPAGGLEPTLANVPGQSILNNREAVREAVSRGNSIAGALRILGLRPAGGNYRALHQACERFGLEVPVYQGAPRAGNAARARISWPGHADLRRMVAASSYAAVGRQLGVSDNAVRKRLQRPAALQSRLPDSNRLPADYKSAALPGELRRQGANLLLPMAACLAIAGLAAGCALALAARDGSPVRLAIAAAACLIVLLAALSAG
jgi:hypothetical protein